MKYVAILLLTLLLASCADASKENDDNRFEWSDQFRSGWTEMNGMLIDTKTGCKYIRFNHGIAPLYKNSHEVDCD